MRGAGPQPAPPRWIPPSLPLELGPALRQERRDPLARILGAEGTREPLALAAKSLIERRLGRPRLDLLDGDRRLLGHLPRPRQRRVEQLVVGDNLVRQPDSVRLVGVDRVSREV